MSTSKQQSLQTAAGILGGRLMATLSLHWLRCTCSTAPVLAANVAYNLCQCSQDWAVAPNSSACAGNRWPQAGANSPKQKGACIHCTAGSVWCPAQHGPCTGHRQTCCCPALGRLSRRLSSTDTLQGALQAALRALQFLVLPQVPAQQATATITHSALQASSGGPHMCLLAAGGCREACRAGSSCHRWASSSCSPSCAPA